jgi:hypothetical protein
MEMHMFIKRKSFDTGLKCSKYIHGKYVKIATDNLLQKPV